MAEKRSFVMYKSWLPMIDTMPDEALADLMRAISAYQQDKGYEIADPMVNAIFSMIIGVFEEDEAKYEETCTKNVRNGKKGGRPKEEKPNATEENPKKAVGYFENPNKPNGFSENPNKAKKADKDKDNDKDIKDKDQIHCTADDVKQIVDHLNQRTGAHYLSTSRKTISLIQARMREGFTVEDFRTVIDKKVLEWQGTDMEKYLWPETLFGPKFEGYLNQSVTAKPLARSPANTFNSFGQRSYDYDALEQALIAKGGGG